MHDTPATAVLFDMDGVLIHSYEAWFFVINATCEHFGTPTLTRDEFDAGWGQGIEKDISCYFPMATQASTLAFWEATFPSQGAHIHLQAGAEKVLAGLEAQGTPVCVVTNTPTNLARSMLHSASLTVKNIVGPGGDIRSKPAPDLVLTACEQLGVLPHDALMVGDSTYDRDAARAAGCRFIAFGDTLAANKRITDLQEVFGFTAPAK